MAGDGGIGKSTLLVSTLLAIAGRQESELGPLRGSIFEGVPGSVLYAAHEDRAAVVASLARWGVASGPWGNAGDEARGEALARFHVLPMRARPLYGPAARESGTGLYNARPERLDGWEDLWEAAAAIRPVVIVVDPALSAAPVAEHSAPHSIRTLPGLSRTQQPPGPAPAPTAAHTDLS